MLRQAKDILGYKIRARDGEIGQVDDLLFDDESWTVRYFVVETGGWLDRKRVLIAPEAVERPDWPVRELPVTLSQEQVRTSPDIDAKQPISRQRELDYRRHYAWPIYWGGGMYPMVPGVWPAAGLYPANPAEPVRGEVRERVAKQESHLRSEREVSGYKVDTADGQVGHVDDFLLDEENWAIRYLLVDTSDWLPGKNTLLPPAAVASVSWVDGSILARATKDELKNAPPFDPDRPVSRDYEAELFNYYDLKPYWQLEREASLRR